MSTAELKNYLHQLIVETDDTSVLKKVKTYFASLKKENETSDWWDKISDAEKKAIKNGITQLKQGKGIKHKDVRKNVDFLLKK
ncbi:MAG: hypothetical protein WBM13_05175 [Bacteroidia bacterium]